MGRNGVGKTSLLKAIAGVHHRSGGDITLMADAWQAHAPTSWPNMGVAYVPQGREIFPLLTVRENLETGFTCLPRSRTPCARRNLRAVSGAEGNAAPPRR